MMPSTLNRLVTRAANRRVGFPWELLIPVIIEMIQLFIEQCTTSKEEWVEIVTSPGPFRQAILLSRIRRAIRAEEGVSPTHRVALSYAIADDLMATASECEDCLDAVYAEEACDA